MNKRVQAGDVFTCSQCGEEFVLSYARDGEPKYCSTECTGEAQRSVKTVECSTCGAPTDADSWELERNDRHYCSRECWRESQRNRLEVQCEVCGTTEEVTPTQAETYRTCSRECWLVIQSGEFSGEGNPNFNSEFDVGQAVKDYESGMNTIEVAKRQGVSDNTARLRLDEAGVDLDDPGFPKKVETERGDLVRSYYEKQVAEWLFDEDIEYDYEPDGFPGPYIPDFVVDGTVIEVWGFSGKEYEARRAEKERWYASNNITVIGIEPDDIGDLETHLEDQP
jgi:hypothetical protein